MRFAIIGFGSVGQALARAFARKNIEVAVAELGIPREDRPYSPHLTLARIKEPAPLDGLRSAVAKVRPIDGFTCMGMPMGTMPASSLAVASAVSSLNSWVGERLASIMSMPISSRITPPAISNAGNVMPNMRKISLPASAKVINTMKQVRAPRRAMRAHR